MLHRTLLTAATAALSLHSGVIARTIPGPAPVPALVARDLDGWVSVGLDGSPTTIQPEVTTINGNTRTISAAPTPTYTTTRNGETITTTGAPPAPTADAENGAGSFIVCDKYQGEHAPFCTPEDGSVLYVGNTYYITWYPLYFADFHADIDIELYSANRNLLFEETLDDAGIGYFAWTVSSDLLEGGTSGSKTIEINIEYKGDDTSNSTTRRNIPGPKVAVRAKGGSSNKSLAIAIPIVVVVVIIGLLAFFFWRRRKNGGGGIRLSGFGFSRRISGYEARQSRSQRTADQDGTPGLDNKGPAFQLQDSPTSPAGRNVFREELRRQEQL